MTATMYGEWCTTLAAERAELERARDARAGALGDAGTTDRFEQTLQAFSEAVATHQTATGCDKHH